MKLHSLVCLVGFVTLAGCQVSSWRPLPPAPQSFGARRLHEVRVIRTDGTRQTLFDVALVGDSLRGLTNPTNVRSATAIPASGVRALEVRRVNGAASIGLAALGLLGLAVVGFFAAMGSGPGMM